MQSTVEGTAFVRRLPLSSDESSTPRSRYFHPNLSIAKPLSSTNSTVEKCNRESRDRLRPTIASFVGRITNAPHPVFSPQSLNCQTLIQYKLDGRKMQSTVEGTTFVQRLPLSSDESSTPRNRFLTPISQLPNPYPVQTRRSKN